ncbi:hypothetical protein HPB50_008245 [Hyalomma asiaticum]|uniref:Uncharacterized protein n=1 Tax=Hyalomma asiaticum TaxID=266040 RepID=A0ACB7T8X8_HYAAI|nr:hypothetical protein HPB50_008245 [Hyalomma asiaticum]
MTGVEEVKVIAYADDVSLFVRDPRSWREFQTLFVEYSAVSGVAMNESKSKALLFGSFPESAIQNVNKVEVVKRTWEAELPGLSRGTLTIDNLGCTPPTIAADASGSRTPSTPPTTPGQQVRRTPLRHSPHTSAEDLFHRTRHRGPCSHHHVTASFHIVHPLQKH